MKQNTKFKRLRVSGAPNSARCVAWTGTFFVFVKNSRNDEKNVKRKHTYINWKFLLLTHYVKTVHEERAWFAYASYTRVYVGSCSTKYKYQVENLPIKQILNVSGPVSSITWGDTPVEESSVSRVKWFAPLSLIHI